ncbi:hypothetical protein Sdagh_51360 [Streptomyces daghestanicus]|uniref:Uncharacterized protein n=1 Tax=Streptomyces daghestanicus TaxID=66885 RepID=A0ABQ3Q802_9ACTN|nr:hypothetical protein Sdagh_51360 [Streptomyces daghestanicus]
MTVVRPVTLPRHSSAALSLSPLPPPTYMSSQVVAPSGAESRVVAGPVLGTAPVTTGVLDDEVPADLGEVEAGAGRIVEGVLASLVDMPDRQGDGVLPGTGTAGLVVNDGMGDLRAAPGVLSNQV